MLATQTDLTVAAVDVLVRDLIAPTTADRVASTGTDADEEAAR